MLQIPFADDFHVHLRQGDDLGGYVADLVPWAGRALVMPNTLPPVVGPDELGRYRQAITAAAGAAGRPEFVPLMAFKITRPGGVWDRRRASSYVSGMRAAGAVAAKLYPLGVTTNAADGVDDLEELRPLLAALEAENLLLLVHGEQPGEFVMDREAAFLPRLEALIAGYPDLRVVLEHVSTEQAVSWVLAQDERVAATVTVHHLLYTLDDLAGDGLRPHLYCKPILKRPTDRAAIQDVVLDGHPRFFFGSDSAPHTKDHKECDCGAAGVYSAPVALPLLATFLEDRGRLERLAPFVAGFGAKHYRLPPPAPGLTLERQNWRVPASYRGVVPLAAGQDLAWAVGLGRQP